MRRIAVAGAGYVGLTTAAAFADLGNFVAVVDVSEEKIRSLKQGSVPFYEPGLAELITRNLHAGRLDFTTSYETALKDARFAFIAVGTPPTATGSADLSAVERAAESIAANCAGPLIVVNKSTVPIGSADFVSDIVARQNPPHPIDVVSNPEFLREGTAVDDFMTPDRVVVGGLSEEAVQAVAELYRPLGAPTLMTDPRSAEMIKYAANAYLAMRISFINEIAQICDGVGADVAAVEEGVGLDHRIGRTFLKAGVGYGGSCFAKDLSALAFVAREHSGTDTELFNAIRDVNLRQRQQVVSLARECLGEVEGRTVALLGLAFKPNTDDMRDAPSIDIATALHAEGAAVRAYDPAATATAKALMPFIDYCTSAYAAALDADAVILVTEWNEFQQIDLDAVREALAQPIFIDGRNMFDPADMKGRGFTYRCLGRNAVV